jgi:hypothetical protein
MTIFEQFNQILKEQNDHVEYESDIKTLLKKEDYTLVFVSTPAHGYFGLVFPDGELELIGEEDDGIQRKDVMKFFKVNQYGEQLKKAK